MQKGSPSFSASSGTHRFVSKQDLRTYSATELVSATAPGSQELPNPVVGPERTCFETSLFSRAVFTKAVFPRGLDDQVVSKEGRFDLLSRLGPWAGCRTQAGCSPEAPWASGRRCSASSGLLSEALNKEPFGPREFQRTPKMTPGCPFCETLAEVGPRLAKGRAEVGV